MAAGKSTVGRLVADSTRRPFVDLDQLVEREAGLSIPQIFEQQGEDAFRSLEQRVLCNLLDAARTAPGSAPVVALGGGALLKRPVRLRALKEATVVTLDAPPEELLRRSSNSKSRPLLRADDPAERLRELLEQRQPAYAEAHAVLSTGGQSPSQLAQQVIGVWQRNLVAVAALNRSYAVEIGSLESRLSQWIQGASTVLLVTDETVKRLHGERVQRVLEESGVRSSVAALSPGEQNKNLRSLEQLFEALFEQQADRKSLVVALGGGVVTDMAGFAAATWMRGIRWVALPSTLLGMVDASVGGKTAVDFRTAKNSVGAFWQPSGVVCDVSLLQTETERAYRGALAEVVKTALIGDAELFELLEQQTEQVVAREPSLVKELVRRSVAVKADVVSRDERESGLRASLNLGHTVGHALESQGGYDRWSHGEAVSLGLVIALRLGQRLGVTPGELADRTIRLLERLKLPIRVDTASLKQATELLAHDKKRRGRAIQFVLAEAVGRVSLRPIELAELAELTLAIADEVADTELRTQ